MKKHNLFIVLLISAAMINGCTSKDMVSAIVDWESFLSKHDMVWNQMASNWKEAPFLGNGMMGAMVWQLDAHTVRWDIGRGDVQDHRPGGGMYNVCRLPVGYFMLKTEGKIAGGTMRVDLWNAEARGVIETDKGTIDWRSVVHADSMLLITLLETTEGEQNCSWEWVAGEPVSPRYAGGRLIDGYEFNPPAIQKKEDDIALCIQPLLVGGETATAWDIEKHEGKSLLYVSVAHSFPENRARDEAIRSVKNAKGTSVETLIESHREWWHAYYPQSFVSIPDKDWESFYWIQMYKLASATRGDRMLIDNQGPWLQPTPWPGVWWNLNAQLTYWPTYASNRLDLGASLGNALYSNMENLINSVPEQYRYNSAAVAGATGQHCSGVVEAPDGENAPMMGLLLWACHNCWLHYRHSMDDEVLRNDLFPLLKRTVNYYFHFLTEGNDGKLHLPRTFSPEYKHGKGPDTNFELALLRWGCGTLVEICDRLDINDPLLPEWNRVLEHLSEYPTDENGYMIARDVPFAQRHRHYSHLLMIYPLYLVNADQPGAEEIAMKSLNHWQSFGVKHGYAVTGASSMSSAFGKGNDALEYLEGLKAFLHPNTLYSEGPGWPVIETPLSGAQSIHDMILQSWGGKIRVFPAVPDAWEDLCFHDLRAEGAFLVSAERKSGETRFVRVKSLAGEPCTIKPGIEGEMKVTGSRDFELKEISPGVFTVDLLKDEEVILYSGSEMPEFEIRPVFGDGADQHSFGLN